MVCVFLHVLVCRDTVGEHQLIKIWLLAATLQQRTTAPDETIPSAFDGQYITNPAPGPGNQAVEWWWFQALAPEVNGIIPSVEAIFYEGSFYQALSSVIVPLC